MNLIIKKEADGLFTFNESTDGVEYDGVSYGSTSVRLNWFNDTLIVNDGQEVKKYDITSEVNYDDGNEIIGFASTIECITTLKDAGFTGNFNTGGATPETTSISSDIITFDSPYEFGTRIAPRTGVLSLDFTNAKIGIIQKVYHNSATTPNILVSGARQGGVYVPSELNNIYIVWVGGTSFEYWITQTLI